MQGLSATFELKRNPHMLDDASSFSLVLIVKRGGLLEAFAVVGFISESDLNFHWQSRETD